MRKPLSVLAAVVGVLVLLGGCGVPVDRAPSALPRAGVPFDLLRPSTPSTTTTTTPSPVEVSVQIFLVGASGHLVGVIGSSNNPVSGLTLTTLIIAALLMVSLGVSGPGGVAVVLGVAAVTREVPAAQESLAVVLDALVAGPTDAETAAGLESAVPAQTKVLGGTTETGGIATVNLGGTFGQLVGQPQIEAVAQVVFTVNTLPGVTGVTFQLSGRAVEVPIASGAQVPMATPAQFAPLAPLPAGSATL